MSDGGSFWLVHLSPIAWRDRMGIRPRAGLGGSDCGPRPTQVFTLVVAYVVPTATVPPTREIANAARAACRTRVRAMGCLRGRERGPSRNLSPFRVGGQWSDRGFVGRSGPRLSLDGKIRDPGPRLSYRLHTTQTHTGF